MTRLSLVYYNYNNIAPCKKCYITKPIVVVMVINLTVVALAIIMMAPIVETVVEEVEGEEVMITAVVKVLLLKALNGLTELLVGEHLV